MGSLRRVFVIPWIIALATSGCGGGSPPRAPNACVPDAAGAAWTLEEATSAGAFEVGMHDEVFVDASRTTPAYGSYAGATSRTLPTTTWYPAVTAGTDAPVASGGPFPIVLYSHGFSSTRTENPGLAALLASHGYVVVSTTFPVSNIDAPAGPTTIDLAGQPRDLSFVLDRVLANAATPGSLFEGRVDAARVAATGLSMGGATTLLVTYHPELRDPRVKLAVAIAPIGSIFTASFYETSEAPLMVVHGTADAILAYEPNATRPRDRAHAPFALVSLERGTHTGFTSIAAAFEDSYDHMDTLGCSGFMQVGGPDPASVDFAGMLGGAAMGVENPPPWDFCPAALGIGMKPTRQLLLESAAVRAQLDAYLAPSATDRGRACHFVERVLPREADVSYVRR